MTRSPLARTLLALNETVSFREMERIALSHGMRYSSSSFEQVAKDARQSRLDIDAIRAIAVVTGLSPVQVAELDDERWGLHHHGGHSPPQIGEGDVENYIRRTLPTDAGDHIITQMKLLRELASHRDAVDPPKGRRKHGAPATPAETSRTPE